MYKNGITILKKQNKITKLEMYFNAGSDKEREGFFGASHLAEHIMCGSIKHLLEDYDRDGIILDAETSSTYVKFSITGLEELIYPQVQEFINNILNSELTEELFNKEKLIVLEEISPSLLDNTAIIFFKSLIEKYGWFGPGGSYEEVQALKFEDFKPFYDEIKNQLFYVVLHTNDENIKLESEYNFVETNIPDIGFEIKNAQGGGYIFKPNAKPLSHNFLLSTPINPQYYSTFIILKSMLAGGLNSVLMQEIREKRGLTYHIDMDCIVRKQNFIFFISFETGEEYEKYKDVLDDILKENPLNYLTETLFDTCKSMLQVGVKLEQETDSLNSKWYDPLYNNKNIDSVTYEDLVNFINIGVLKSLDLIYERI